MIGAESTSWLIISLEIMAVFFIVVAGLAVLVMIVLFIYDTRQNKQAILKNFPVIGHFRYLFEHLGEFFRQYFYSMDREELPFNRAHRSWAYRAAKDLNNTVAFGSTRNLLEPGTVTFVNCPYPTLNEDAVPIKSIVIGSGCKKPYEAKSFLNISGMSFGAISRPAIIALSNGARKSDCWLNTGEGGLSSYHLEGGADIVYQIGTAKYGVRNQDGGLDDDHLKAIASHEQVKMFEIKLSQGAKPGKGGILPGIKVTAEIASIRGIPVGKDSISPNRHIDISNDDDLLDMIMRIRNVTGKPVGFKAVLSDSHWLDGLFKNIHERGIESAPDFITVDSADGGTGAAPMSLMDDVGLPLRESLPMLVDKVTEYGLRERIKIIASGKLITPTRVAAALCMGADFIVTARGFMFSLGCIQSMQCNKNTCPTGITTHNDRLQKGLNPVSKTERVANYHHNLMYEVCMIAHSCGVQEPRELDRQHARVFIDNGLSVPMDEFYPPSQEKYHFTTD
ncbi:MAG: FMN-binding glutamate synthase family protein [Gammaproteobacteria bacterium]|nr:FMN-binding glutamate synthase family protein [Gammaproteobacteria bacterium]